jgi:hypothetical protein
MSDSCYKTVISNNYQMRNIEMKRYILTSVALMTVATVATVATAGTSVTPIDPSTSPIPQFEKVDTNGDGSISIKEAAAINLTTKQFKMVDANKDGLLSRVEYEASMVDKTS